jgi:hypothetical protein
MFVGNFCTPGSGSGLRIRTGYGSRHPIESGFTALLIYVELLLFKLCVYVATLPGLELAIPRFYSFAYKKKKGSRRAGVICMHSCVLYEARTLYLIPIRHVPLEWLGCLWQTYCRERPILFFFLRGLGREDLLGQ